jgi:uncharacterized membrane protein YjfL (UPF0719 family)
MAGAAVVFTNNREDIGMLDFINPVALVGSLIYSLLGVAVFWVSFIIIDLLTPYRLWDEIVKERNLPLSILAAAMCLGVSIIVAAAIHG